MKKIEKKKVFDLYSNNEKISNLIEDLKSNSKVYLKLMYALQILGTFNGKMEVEIYDVIDTEDERKIRFWCSDVNGNFFIFYVLSTNKNDLLKITKETNEQVYECNLVLAKKFPLNESNIDFTRCGNITDVKFGRLISNNKDFYSIFMGNDIGYQIQGDFNISLTQSLINKINKLSSVPNLSEYLKLFEDVIAENNCTFSKMQVSAFKNFERIGNLVFNDKSSAKEKNNLKRIK